MVTTSTKSALHLPDLRSVARDVWDFPETCIGIYLGTCLGIDSLQKCQTVRVSELR